MICVILSPVGKGNSLMTSEWKEITAFWKGDLTFIGTNPAGGTVQIGAWDGKPGLGPMELVLIALATCTAMDIVDILKKKRQLPTDLQLRVRGKRADTFPRVYTKIEVEYLIWGSGIRPADVEQAIRLSEEKYCSVGVMLEKTAALRSTYRILEPGQSAG